MPRAEPRGGARAPPRARGAVAADGAQQHSARGPHDAAAAPADVAPADALPRDTGPPGARHAAGTGRAHGAAIRARPPGAARAALRPGPVTGGVRRRAAARPGRGIASAMAAAREQDAAGALGVACASCVPRPAHALGPGAASNAVPSAGADPSMSVGGAQEGTVRPDPARGTALAGTAGPATTNCEATIAPGARGGAHPAAAAHNTVPHGALQSAGRSHVPGMACALPCALPPVATPPVPGARATLVVAGTRRVTLRTIVPLPALVARRARPPSGVACADPGAVYTGAAGAVARAGAVRRPRALGSAVRCPVPRGTVPTSDACPVALTRACASAVDAGVADPVSPANVAAAARAQPPALGPVVPRDARDTLSTGPEAARPVRVAFTGAVGHAAAVTTTLSAGRAAGAAEVAIGPEVVRRAGLARLPGPVPRGLRLAAAGAVRKADPVPAAGPQPPAAAQHVARAPRVAGQAGAEPRAVAAPVTHPVPRAHEPGAPERALYGAVGGGPRGVAHTHLASCDTHHAGGRTAGPPIARSADVTRVPRPEARGRGGGADARATGTAVPVAPALPPGSVPEAAGTGLPCVPGLADAERRPSARAVPVARAVQGPRARGGACDRPRDAPPPGVAVAGPGAGYARPVPPADVRGVGAGAPVATLRAGPSRAAPALPRAKRARVARPVGPAPALGGAAGAVARRRTACGRAQPRRHGARGPTEAAVAVAVAATEANAVATAGVPALVCGAREAAVRSRPAPRADVAGRAGPRGVAVADPHRRGPARPRARPVAPARQPVGSRRAGHVAAGARVRGGAAADAAVAAPRAGAVPPAGPLRGRGAGRGAPRARPAARAPPARRAGPVPGRRRARAAALPFPRDGPGLALPVP